MTQGQLEELVIKNLRSTAQLVEVSKRTSLDVDKLTKHMEESLPLRQQFVQLQKEVEETKLEILKNKKEADDKFSILSPVFTALKYPYVLLIAMFGTYALAISEIRWPIIETIIKFWK